jgi:plastocyanin
MKTTLLAIAALLPIAFAQDYGNSSPKSTSSSSAAASPSAAADTGSSGKVHVVEVGESGFVFDPDTMTAAPGDVIQFQVYPTHSVARSTFNSPCEPMNGAGAIWTGFSSNENTFFTVTVNDTQPIWLYCAAPTHCQLGMAMVINPP